MPGEGIQLENICNPSVCDINLELWRVEAGLVRGEKTGDHTDHFCQSLGETLDSDPGSSKGQRRRNRWNEWAFGARRIGPVPHAVTHDL